MGIEVSFEKGSHTTIHTTSNCVETVNHIELLQNVCKYVRKTREFAETVPGSHVTFVSNNAYE